MAALLSVCRFPLLLHCHGARTALGKVNSRLSTSNNSSRTGRPRPVRTRSQQLCCQATVDGTQMELSGSSTMAVTEGEKMLSDEEMEWERLQLDQVAREQMKARAAVEEALSDEVEGENLNGLTLDDANKVASTSDGVIEGREGEGSFRSSGSAQTPPPGAWKWKIRKRIWNCLEKKGLAAAPRPVHHRIPNFVGADEAAEKLASLPEFASATMVKVNPDTPQKHVRFLTLSGGKTMITPQPRLRTGFFSLLDPRQLAPEDLVGACSSRGAAKLSAPLGLFAKLKVDLIVVGSVAVDPTTGARLGKGEGFAELEYGMLRWMGAVDDSTLVVTSVHDEQLVNDIPVEKLLVHDLPVDIICTPTRIIRVENSPIPKPTGIFWEKLSPEKLKSIKILQELKAHIEKESGATLPLGPSEPLPPTARRKRTNPSRQKVPGGKQGMVVGGDSIPTEGEPPLPAPASEKKGTRARSGRDAKWLENANRVFVRNLNKETKWTELAMLFEESAGVKPIMVDVFRVQDRDRAVARVALPAGTDVSTVIGSVDGAELLGRRIIVQEDEQEQRGTGELRRAMDYPTRVFVKGLSKGTMKSTLAAALEGVGVKAERIEFLLLDGRPRGFARVALADGTDAGEVVKRADGIELEGKILRVQEDKPGPKVDYEALRALQVAATSVETSRED